MAAKRILVTCLCVSICILMDACRPLPAEPIDVEIPEGFVTVTADQAQLAAKVKTLPRGMTRQEVKRGLGSPAEETSGLLFYELLEGAEGGHYVTAQLSFEEQGLTYAKLGFGHVTRELGIEP